MNYRNLLLVLCLVSGLVPVARAEVVISQYYEGTSFNKWLELSNTSDTAISLDGFVLTRWANAAQASYAALHSLCRTGIVHCE